MAVDRARASRMALFGADIENIFGQILKVIPPGPHGIPVLPVEIAAPLTVLHEGDWAVEGQLRCDDDLSILQTLRSAVGISQNNYFYGFLLRRLKDDPKEDFQVGDFLALVRGTMQPIEWLLNVAAAPDLLSRLEHKTAGFVPAGFWSIYESMRLVTPDGQDVGPAARAIGDIVNRDNKPLTVVGHSLGAVLSAYLTLDLASEVANPAKELNAYLIACPQPGTPDFASAFKAKVPQYNVINWWRDIVPQVPPLPYISLLNGSPDQNVLCLMPAAKNPPEANAVTPATEPPDNPGGNHHAVNYAYMLDPKNDIAEAAAEWIKANPNS